jgi:hypothetical protein
MRALFAVFVLASMASAAPALGDKPPRWEYAELIFRGIPGRPAGIDADGKEVAAVPASMSIRWMTKAGEVEVKSWAELADKLKTTLKKDSTVVYQKLQILNALGDDGWELMEQQTTTTVTPVFDNQLGGRGPGGRAGGTSVSSMSSNSSSTWLLKRRVLP